MVNSPQKISEKTRPAMSDHRHSLTSAQSGSTSRSSHSRLSFSRPTSGSQPRIHLGADPVINSPLDSHAENRYDKLKCFQRSKDPNKIYIALEKYFPQCHKAKVVVWADLTVDAVDRLNESLNADHIKQVLADIFELDNYKDNLKTGIKMDLFYYTLQFARDQSFSPEKTSAFFSIIKKIFEVCIETPYGNLDHTFKYFKDLLLCHSVNRPPYSIELFSPHEVRKISEYTINTFFRHFKMYKYAFTPLVRLDLAISYIGMPPSPPPSDDQPAETVDEDALAAQRQKEYDEAQEAAREELRGMVREFLSTESKKIEGNVENHIKTAVASLNTQIDNMLDTAPEKGKKKK